MPWEGIKEVGVLWVEVLFYIHNMATKLKKEPIDLIIIQLTVQTPWAFCTMPATMNHMPCVLLLLSFCVETYW